MRAIPAVGDHGRGWSFRGVVFATAVAVAIAAVAVAIFQGDKFAAIGYALFGVCAGWSFWDGGNERLRALEEQDEDADARVESGLRQDEAAAGREVSALTADIGQLRGANQTLVQLTEQLRAESQQMRVQNDALGRENQRLTADLASLQQSNQALRDLVTHFTQQNQLLTQSLHNMEAAPANASVAAEHFVALHRALEGDLKNVGSVIADVKQATNALTRALQSTLHASSEERSAHAAAINETLATMKQEADRIATLLERLSAAKGSQRGSS